MLFAVQRGAMSRYAFSDLCMENFMQQKEQNHSHWILCPLQIDVRGHVESYGFFKDVDTHQPLVWVSQGENRVHLSCFCCEFIESFDLKGNSIALLCLFALCVAQ